MVRFCLYPFYSNHVIIHRMITIDNVVKQYGSQLVLRGASLQVDAGQFVTLVGANGAGKSTLLKMVATLSQPTSGSVTVGGWPLRSHAENVRQHLGLISHQSLLYPDLTAGENLHFFAKLYGIPDRNKRVQATLKRVGLSTRERDPVRTFSRGMVQRLTIARATLHEPDILLLDEPYTGLDQQASNVLDQLLQAEKSAGRTILMITHDLHSLSFCDRVVMLHKGKIGREWDATAIDKEEIIAQYQSILFGETV